MTRYKKLEEYIKIQSIFIMAFYWILLAIAFFLFEFILNNKQAFISYELNPNFTNPEINI